MEKRGPYVNWSRAVCQLLPLSLIFGSGDRGPKPEVGLGAPDQGAFVGVKGHDVGM